MIVRLALPEPANMSEDLVCPICRVALQTVHNPAQHAGAVGEFVGESVIADTGSIGHVADAASVSNNRRCAPQPFL